MKKLFLLLFLIPVLSWADCFSEQGKTYDLNNKRYYDSHSPEYQKKAHCEAHRCAALNQLTPTCLCENLGGLVKTHQEGSMSLEYWNNASFCEAAVYLDGSNGHESGYFQLPHFFEKPITPTTTPTTTPTPTVSIEDAKVQCTDIGFKKGTEKFGDCVLELMQ